MRGFYGYIYARFVVLLLNFLKCAVYSDCVEMIFGFLKEKIYYLMLSIGNLLLLCLCRCLNYFKCNRALIPSLAKVEIDRLP